MTRLTLTDIPPEFLYESASVPLSNSYVRFAVGVCQQLNILDTPSGLHLLQASWQLRFGLVAKGLHNNALPMPNAIGEEAQFIALAAFQLALVSGLAGGEHESGRGLD